MLETYKKQHAKTIIQYLVVDFNGQILETDNVLFDIKNEQNITNINPFFETLIPLLKSENEDYFFNCIHLHLNEKLITADISLKTFNKETYPLITIVDLTSHYKHYQTTAQVRNESVINSEVLELKNSYLKEKEEFKNRFIANFSHELRDPITGIITFSDILKNTQLNDEQLNYLQILKSSSNFLKKMVDDILDISRIEVGKLELTIKPFDIRSLIQDINANYSIRAKEKGLEYFSSIDEKLPAIVGGDALRLRQVLTNLLDNAIKFTEKGNITFNVSLNQIRAQKANVHFEITDTGIGIAPDKLESIFENFTQINNPLSFKGAGLGLAIVKYLVELTRSKISVKSSLGKGSIFSTNINFKIETSKKPHKKDKTLIKEIRSDKKFNILLVEDSEITQLSILKILAKKGQFFLDIVSNANDVIPRIESSEFDLVLMDIKLQDQWGDEIAKKIRKLPEREHKKVPIIALTAKVFSEDLKKYKKAGINDVIKKPFDEISLLNTIGKYLK